MFKEWESFHGGIWEKEINVRDFIQKNYTPYDGNEDFLQGPTQRTKDLWDQVMKLTKEEQAKGGVLDMDTRIISTITSHGPGYLDKDKETIVGFQTDKPFKRSLQPYGGIRMAVKACEDHGYHVDPQIVEFFTKHRKTHNDGVFDAYTPEMRACRSSHIITGLPDAYGRGRIIGDYRRVALYGVDRLIQDKQQQKDTTRTIMYSDVTREREELSEQIKALKELKELGRIYGFDISRARSQYPGSDSVAVFRLPGCHQRTERRRHVSGQNLYFPGYLCSEGSCKWNFHRRRDPGVCRSFYHETASGKICQNP